MRFEPSGFTGNPEIPRATSVMDYLFRWLGAKFLRAESDADGTEDGKDGAKPVEEPKQAPVAETTVQVGPPVEVIDRTTTRTNGNGTPSMYGFLVRTDAPTCSECGSIMVPNGSCHKCTNCGTTSGCS